MRASGGRTAAAGRAVVQLACSLAGRAGIYVHPATLTTFVKMIRQRFGD